MAVHYEPNTAYGSGLGMFMRGPEMRRHMNSVGLSAAGAARGYSSTPNAIRWEPAQAFNRQVVNVVNTARDARIQEYGGRVVAPLAPLGRVLAQIRAADPNNSRANRLGF